MQMIKKTSALALSGLFTIAAVEPVGAPAWNVDGAHTEINFLVTHFFTPVTGSFTEFDVDLDFDAADVSNSRVYVRIDAASVDTGNRRRDDHLRSADFLDTAAHPYITFVSHDFKDSGAGRIVAVGDLNIKGITRRIELPIRLLGTRELPPEVSEMLGGVREVASFEAETTIDRGDFGVGAGSWAATLVVGGDVDVSIALEAHRTD